MTVTIISVRVSLFLMQNKVFTKKIVAQHSVLHGLTFILVSLPILTPGYINPVGSNFSEQSSTVVYLIGNVPFLADNILCHSSTVNYHYNHLKNIIIPCTYSSSSKCSSLQTIPCTADTGGHFNMFIVQTGSTGEN